MKNMTKRKFISFFLAMTMLFLALPLSPIGSFATGEEEETSVSDLTAPFRPDVEFMINGEPKKSQSYRIPSMVTLDDGTIVAAADIRWNTTYDGGGLDTLVARSTDGGKSWSYTVANYLGDNGNEYNGAKSTTFIDPSLLVAADGHTVYMLVDLYAYGIALNGSGNTQPGTDNGFDVNGNLKLSNNNHSSYDYYLKDGKIYDSSNKVVEGYSVDAYFNITDPNNVKSNLFYADSPFKVARTQYLYLTKSTDGGATWSAPNLLDVRAKSRVATIENALLASPGNAITTSDGVMVFPMYSYTPNDQYLSLIYSTDGENWARTDNYTGLGFSSEGAVVELQNGNLRVFVRNKTGYLCYVDFDMTTKTWIGHTQTAVPTNSNTQLSAITYSRTSDGKQVILVSCPTGPNEAGSSNNDGSCRTNGKIHVFTVNNDANSTLKLENKINLFEHVATNQLSGSTYTEEQGFYAYSALTERADGSILVQFENNQFGWGASGSNKDGTYNPSQVTTYFTITIEGFTSSALGIKLDDPKNIIVDANGNRIDSVTMSQYEKPELTAKSPFATADVDYQWQIEYEDGKWVDIYGEDGATIKISYGMVATLLDDDGKVNIRCETKSGSKTAYSAVIPVTLEMYVPEEPDVVVSESFTSSTGETVTVTVAGSLPEDASVQLEETDSTGVDVKPSETVVAALDISIKNADGSEWQPESGETVTVTLEASKIGLSNGDDFVVYHLHNGEVRVLGSYTVANNTVSFDVDGFSKFVFALSEQTLFSDDLISNIGKTATINDGYINFDAFNDPQSGEEPTAFMEDRDYSKGIEFFIRDVYVSDTYPYRIYYKVEIKSGEVYAENFGSIFWIYQGYQDEDPSWGTLVLHDAPEPEPDPEPAEPSVSVTVDGEEVTEITVSTAQKVTLTATPNVEGTTTYQWQILIPAANMWVNMSGQTSANCVVYYGMVANGLNSEGKAQVRCVTKVDGVTITGEPIEVSVATTLKTAHRASRSSAGDTTGKYTVTVYYYVGDSTVMHREVLTMEFGVNEEPKTTSFPIPERKGYTAFYFGTNANTGIENGEEYTGSEYVLPNFKPTSDMSLYVRYYPNDDTPYTVEHYFQNVTGDGPGDYTLYYTEYLSGTTDAYIPEFDITYGNGTLANNYEALGFYATPYKRDTISADGNTVVKIYYDRYMYLLMFNLGEGGTGVEPIFARVGVEYTVENEPTRRGYVFQGWQLEDGTTINKDAKPYVFEVPPRLSTVTALWSAGTTQYTVVYWKENADPEPDGSYGYSYWTHAVVAADTGMVVDGKNDIVTADTVTDVTANDLTHFTFNDVATDKGIVVKGNGSTVVNVYYLRNFYEIYFYAHGNSSANNPGGCGVTAHTHDGESCVKYPICAVEEHVHVDSCVNLGLKCTTAIHEHTDACCTKTVHAAHTSACCTDTVHANHTTSCYDNVNTGQRPNDGDLTRAPSNPVDGQIYRRSNGYNRIIYINGTWYRYSGNNSSGSVIQPNTRCPGLHTHGDGNCTYIDALHTHGDGTCTYDHAEHREHTDDCYDWDCGASVVHEHTDKCYSACVLPAHNHTSGCTNGTANNRTRYLIKIIRAKYDADISKEWPVADDSIAGLSGFASWNGNGTPQSSRVVTMNSDWCNSNGIRVNADYDSIKYQLNYWFEDWDQDNKTTSSTRKLYNGKYYVLSDKYTQVAYYGSTNGWGHKKITGMEATTTQNAQRETVNGVYTFNLHYNRVRRDLYFVSDNETIDEFTQEDIPYEMPLKNVKDENGNYVSTFVPPENPVDKPANGYYFEGWYTTSECFPGTKVDFNTLTMPMNDLTLFANWAPRTHKVEFFFDSTLNTRLDETKFPTLLVLHNEYGADPGKPGHPLDFEAITWFYVNSKGEEKTFTFDMPVTEDMKLYPKWRTNVYIKYEVRYKVYDQLTNTYTDIEIAAPLYGEELYGELVTLYPKGTEEFYDAYKQEGNGYFPMGGSHSISMGEQSCTGNPPYTYCTWDEETSTHIFTFYYVNGPTIPYTVEYHEVDANGNFVKKLLEDKYVADNYYAKVVENAAIIPGYMPDKAQDTLYVVYQGENKIIFEYTVDENASFYRVSHWIKKYGSNEYVLIQPYDDFASRVGDIISNYPSLVLPGVTHTHTVINPSDNTVGKTENGQPGLTVDLYYEEESVTINYVVKGPDGCGTLTLYTETVGAYYGTVVGSQATASSNVYKFVGWYSDEACTKPVTYDATNNKFVPSKVNGLHVAATYYAKFEYNLTQLTIHKEGWSSLDPNQTFLFTITDEDGLELTVTVHQDGSTTIDGLTVGKEYTITEKTDWSWRYQCTGWTHGNDSGSGNVATITLGLNGTITFTNSRSEEKWLDGDSWCDNLFNAITGGQNN